MTFEALLRLVREQRVRIADLRGSAERSDDDIATMRVEQSLYDGRLLELGTHAELLARGDRYAALFATWTGGLAPAT